MKSRFTYVRYAKRIMASLMSIVIFVCFACTTSLAINLADGQKMGTVRSYTGEGFLIVFCVTDSWGDGHNVDVTIVNTGNLSIRDWKCSFDYGASVVNAWNAEMTSNAQTCEAEAYYCSWNRELMPGSSCSFGFSCNGSFTSFPQRCYLETGVFNENTSCDVNVTISQSWNGGCVGGVVIQNASDADVRDWMLEFDTELQVDSVWNGIVQSKNEGHYVISSADYNCRISAGGSVTVGFQARGDVSGELFSNLCLKTVGHDDSRTETDNQGNEDDNKDPNPDENGFVSNENNEEANENNVDSDEDDSNLNSDDGNDENQNEGLVVAITDEEIGEMYYKPAQKEDIVTDAETGICYVSNQILVSAVPDATRETLIKLFEECGATVVGFIELTNDFQIEFAEAKTITELTDCIDWLEGSDLIAYASLNISSETEGDGNWTEYECNDELYNDGVTAENIGGEKTRYAKLDPDELTDERFHGDNWALKELNIPNAWKLVGKSGEQVRVGILDVGFVEGTHEDLSTLKVYHNSDYKRYHGTHVAGIIGADHNEIGIAGVATNVQLYGWASDRVNSVMGDKVALATLVGKHVRVINFSMGYLDEIAYSVQLEQNAAINMTEESSNAISEFLIKLYQQGYDFVIITAAGNGNNKKYSVSPDLSGIYLRDDHGIRVREIEAKNNSDFNSITDSNLQNRIIVVASTRPEKPGMPKGDLVSDANCVGERVDVYAPGEDVLSTVPVDTEGTAIPGYKVDRGTSFAAPHISGIAALMYQANPDLRADQIKEIICADENSRGSYTDSMGVTRNMPDAEKCVRAALDLKDGEGQEKTKENGILMGKIQLSDGKKSEGVQVLLTENDLTAPMMNDTFEFSTTSDGTFVCSVPEGTYKMSIQKQGYLPYLAWNVEVISEETNNLGTIELARVPSMMRLKGKVYHAGKGIPEATVRVRQGFRNKEGDYLLDEEGSIIEACSDEDGYFEIEILEGEYTFEFTKDGYAPEYNNIRMELDANGRQTIEREIEVVYKYEDSYRIVLEWNKNSVTDLDICASVIAYGRNAARVSAKSHDNWLVHPEMRVIKDAKTGAETETILIAESEYILHEDRIYLAISVSDEYCRYGTTSGLHYDLGATIYLYKGDKLLQVFKAPRSIDRRVWYAFNIKEGDRIEVVNINTDAEP